MADINNLHRKVSGFFLLLLFKSMNPSNFFFHLFFSSFPSWTMCTFREHKENWQTKEVSSSVVWGSEILGLCVLSMVSSGEAGPKRLKTQGLDVHLLHDTWQKCLDEWSVIPPVSCTADLLPHHQKIPEQYKVISGDPPDLETHKGSYKTQQLRTKWDY